MKIKFVIIFLLMLAFFSCRTEQDKKLQLIAQDYNLDIFNGKKVVLIIPVNGCKSCIKPCFKFAKANLAQKNIIFVISSIVKKDITILFNENELSNKNLISDCKGKAFGYDLVSSQPTIFFISSGKAEKKILIEYNNAEKVLNEALNFVK